jgi:hypothetical protein
MTEPIPVRVLRHLCPHCRRSHSRPSRAREHMARCWLSPESRGCKTCQYFRPAVDDRCDAPNGCGACGVIPESCEVGVELADVPIVHCELWEARADPPGGTDA